MAKVLPALRESESNINVVDERQRWNPGPSLVLQIHRASFSTPSNKVLLLAGAGSSPLDDKERFSRYSVFRIE